MLNLPGEQEIATEIARNVDPELIHNAREMVRAPNRQGPGTVTPGLWSRRPPRGAYSPDRREVRASDRSATRCWRSLPAANPAAAPRSPRRTSRARRNMTDEIGALAALIAHAERRTRAGARASTTRITTILSWSTNGSRSRRRHPVVAAIRRVRRAASSTRSSARNRRTGCGPHRHVRHRQSDRLQRRRRRGIRLLADVVMGLDPDQPAGRARGLAASFKGWQGARAERRRRGRARAREISRTRQRPVTGQFRDRLPLPATGLERSL